jgi:hypothetical protein
MKATWRRRRVAKVAVYAFNLSQEGKSMSKITPAGINLAKKAFALHGSDEEVNVQLHCAAG